MKITKEDIKILFDLYKSVEGLTPYIFYQRYKYGPATVFNTVLKFENKKYIYSDEGKLILTKEGREYVESNRFNFPKNKFEKIPEEFVIPKLSVDEPYLPNIKIISKYILNLDNKR